MLELLARNTSVHFTLLAQLVSSSTFPLGFFVFWAAKNSVSLLDMAEYDRPYHSVAELVRDYTPIVARYTVGERKEMLRLGLNKRPTTSAEWYDAYQDPSEVVLLLAQRHPGFLQNPHRFLGMMDVKLSVGQEAKPLAFPIKYGPRERRDHHPPLPLPLPPAPAPEPRPEVRGRARLIVDDVSDLEEQIEDTRRIYRSTSLPPSRGEFAELRALEQLLAARLREREGRQEFTARGDRLEVVEGFGLPPPPPLRLAPPEATIQLQEIRQRERMLSGHIELTPSEQVLRENMRERIGSQHVELRRLRGVREARRQRDGMPSRNIELSPLQQAQLDAARPSIPPRFADGRTEDEEHLITFFNPFDGSQAILDTRSLGPLRPRTSAELLGLVPRQPPTSAELLDRSPGGREDRTSERRMEELRLLQPDPLHRYLALFRNTFAAIMGRPDKFKVLCMILDCEDAPPTSIQTLLDILWARGHLEPIDDEHSQREVCRIFEALDELRPDYMGEPVAARADQARIAALPQLRPTSLDPLARGHVSHGATTERRPPLVGLPPPHPPSKKDKSKGKKGPEVHSAESEDEDNTCSICYHNYINAVFVDCGHMYCCIACAEKLFTNTQKAERLCPICRTQLKHKPVGVFHKAAK
jgi:hypothetical protein